MNVRNFGDIAALSSFSILAAFVVLIIWFFGSSSWLSNQWTTPLPASTNLQLKRILLLPPNETDEYVAAELCSEVADNPALKRSARLKRAEKIASEWWENGGGPYPSFFGHPSSTGGVLAICTTEKVRFIAHALAKEMNLDTYSVLEPFATFLLAEMREHGVENGNIFALEDKVLGPDYVRPSFSLDTSADLSAIRTRQRESAELCIPEGKTAKWMGYADAKRKAVSDLFEREAAKVLGVPRASLNARLVEEFEEYRKKECARLNVPSPCNDLELLEAAHTDLSRQRGKERRQLLMLRQEGKVGIASPDRHIIAVNADEFLRQRRIELVQEIARRHQLSPLTYIDSPEDLARYYYKKYSCPT